MNHLQKKLYESLELVYPVLMIICNNLCGKLVSSLEFLIKFDEIFRITSLLFLFQILTT